MGLQSSSVIFLIMFKTFAVGWIFFLSAVLLERCSGLQMVGSCTFQEYIDKARQCTTAFIADLQKDPFVDCKIIYDRMVECTKDYVRDCVRGLVPDNDIEAFLTEAAKQLKSEDFYCKDGLFSKPILIDEQKKEIPCNETFFNESRVCGDTFQTKFRRNRADKSLCKEFTAAKSCLKEAVDQYCQFDADAAEILQPAFDGYNPFCIVSSEEEDEDEGYYLQDAQLFDQCSMIAQLNRTRQCITLFIRSLQQDPQGNCSVKYIYMQDCIVCMLRSCLQRYGFISEADIEVQAEESLNRTNPENFYCRGMLEAPKASSEDEDLQCDEGFFEEEVKCLKEFNDTFIANVSDPTLCSKFSESKQCLRDLITTRCPSGSRTSSLEFALIFDDYNPFCWRGTDQEQDAALPSPTEELSDPCLAEFPTAPLLLRSKGRTLSQSHSLSFVFFYNLLGYLTTWISPLNQR